MRKMHFWFVVLAVAASWFASYCSDRAAQAAEAGEQALILHLQVQPQASQPLVGDHYAVTFEGRDRAVVVGRCGLAASRRVLKLRRGHPDPPRW